MIDNQTILAKPHGVPLEDHVSNLLEETKKMLAAREFVVRKYRERTRDDLGEAVREGVRWHDEGKKHSKWQSACRLDYEEYMRAKERDPNAKVRGRHLRQVGMRHELWSLELMRAQGVKTALPVRVAVAAHHSKLGHKHRKRWKDFEIFWAEFAREGSAFRTSDPESFERALEHRYKFAGPRSLLQLVDHRASASEEREELPEFKSFNYSFPYSTRRGVQRVIEELWDEPFAILRAPTGAGKTDAALLWAQHQIKDRQIADRLVIAMPTRFTANALSISTAENLSAIGLYHSSAWYQRIKGKASVRQREQCLIDKEQVLARKLETPVTVTTIDHLCICLTGTREDHHATFFNLAHSCVVIDEADFYDDFTQQNIVTLLRALRTLEVPVLLMSATVPESVRDVYSKSGFIISKIFEDKSDYERVRCVVKKHCKAEKPEQIADLLQRALNGEPTIIYANTVRRAQAYYRWFVQQFGKRGEPEKCEDLVIYHSRFTEPHKVDKEAKLVEMLGSDAWAYKDDKRPCGIAILTQIGEISVNISADLMISDMCPLDRLAQRAGRLSRFDKRGDDKRNAIGELFIIEPLATKKTGEPVSYPAPYGTYDKGKREWLPAEAFSKSIELLFDGEYSAKTFVVRVNQLYPSARKIEPLVRINQRALEDCIVLNWLILPAEQVEKINGVEPDDDHTKDWKSRDIPPQVTVYAIQELVESGEFNQYFPNKSKFREFQLRHGLQCYVYEFNHAVEAQIVELMTFQIGEESQEQVFVLRPEFYNSKMGLLIDKELSSKDDEDIITSSSPGII